METVAKAVRISAPAVPSNAQTVRALYVHIAVTALVVPVTVAGALTATPVENV